MRKKSSSIKTKYKSLATKMKYSREQNMTYKEKINFVKITETDTKNSNLSNKISDKPLNPFESKNKSSKVPLTPKKNTSIR